MSWGPARKLGEVWEEFPRATLGGLEGRIWSVSLRFLSPGATRLGQEYPLPTYKIRLMSLCVIFLFFLFLFFNFYKALGTKLKTWPWESGNGLSLTLSRFIYIAHSSSQSSLQNILTRQLHPRRGG